MTIGGTGSKRYRERRYKHLSTKEAAEAIMRCPVCGNEARVTLVEDWRGHAVPIIGCGNPWHYTNIEQPDAGT